MAFNQGPDLQRLDFTFILSNYEARYHSEVLVHWFPKAI